MHIFSFILFMKKLYSMQVVMLNIDTHKMQLCANNHVG